MKAIAYSEDTWKIAKESGNSISENMIVNVILIYIIKILKTFAFMKNITLDGFLSSIDLFLQSFPGLWGPLHVPQLR